MPKIPVTILTGFLGAGKTTLLNRILSSPSGEGTAVIVNEFGDVGIDARLLSPPTAGAQSPAPNIIELSNGALCCAAMGDTVQVLAQLIDLSATKEVKRVLIETTGLADPFPLIKAFLNRPTLAKAYALDAIVTVVDAFHVLGQLETMSEAREQIAAADIMLLNKTDLVDAASLDAVEEALKKINPQAIVRRTTRSETDVDALFDVQGGRPFEEAEGFKTERHGHAAGVMSLVLRETQPLSLDKFASFVATALMLNAQDLLRYKGILNVAGKNERFVFQGLHHHFETLPDRAWKDGEERVSEVVLIGKNLDRAYFEDTFRACVAD